MSTSAHTRPFSWNTCIRAIWVREIIRQPLLLSTAVLPEPAAPRVQCRQPLDWNRQRSESMAGSDTVKFMLGEDQIPTAWLNIVPDLNEPPAPALHPGTGQPAGPDDFAPLFPMAIIQQEVTTERYVEIPDPVRDIYKLWRPTPLYRAARLEKALDLPENVRIFYKYEGNNAAGSHKPNTAVAQAWYNKQEGVKRITTETGAGQWGSSLAMACAFFDIDL